MNEEPASRFLSRRTLLGKLVQGLGVTAALGPVTQLVYGAALPGQLVPNITGANVTAGVGLHAADLLTDLKSGWLLGAKPRQQLVGQLFGAVAGTMSRASLMCRPPGLA